MRISKEYSLVLWNWPDLTALAILSNDVATGPRGSNNPHARFPKIQPSLRLFYFYTTAKSSNAALGAETGFKHNSQRFTRT